MASLNISDIKPEQWVAVFEPEPLVAAYLFGSQARGASGPLSDVDVAVLASESLAGKGARFDLRLRLTNALISMLQVNQVDVVVLNDAPLLLQHRVLRDGLVLFCRDELARVRYETQAILKYLDFQHIEHMHNEALMRRIEEEGLFARP